MELSTSQGAPLSPLSKRLSGLSTEAPLSTLSKGLLPLHRSASQLSLEAPLGRPRLDAWRRLLSTLPFTLGVSRETFLPPIEFSLNCKEQICIQSATKTVAECFNIVNMTFFTTQPDNRLMKFVSESIHIACLIIYL